MDSLIVTDLIELARNHAITDALILSGDGDIKIGVQVAQTFGVRIRLLCIKPARGSQSRNLMMEADACHERDEAKIGEWMQFEEEAADLSSESPAVDLDPGNVPASGSSPATLNDFRATAVSEVKGAIKALSAIDLERHVQFLDNDRKRIQSNNDRPASGNSC